MTFKCKLNDQLPPKALGNRPQLWAIRPAACLGVTKGGWRPTMCQTLSSTCYHMNHRVPAITASTVVLLKTVAPDGKRCMEALRTLLLLFRTGLDPGAGKLSLHLLKGVGSRLLQMFPWQEQKNPRVALEGSPQPTSPVQTQTGWLETPSSQNPTHSSKKGEKARVVPLFLSQ